MLRPRRVDPVGPVADEPVRTMVVWVPDWPVVAAGVGADVPAAVFVANRVVACTAAARAADVRRHMRRREAQARCPALVVLDHDPDRDARSFEPVAQVLETFTPRIEIARPGRAAFPTRGPSRYFGGDDALASQVLAAVGEVLGDRAVTVGVADGPFAAGHAARTAYGLAARGDAGVHIVAPGTVAEYLAPLSLRALELPDLADVLARLGLHTLGDLAALPAVDVLGRFGPVGAEAHRLACGLDLRPPATTPPPPDLVVAIELDPPAEQVGPLAFVARGLADEFHARLEARGSACTRLVVIAETETGERSERVWRHEGALTAGAIADRVRWQMDGWLNAQMRLRPTAGVMHLELHPDEVVAADGRQLGFWGGDAGAADRAVRAIARVQGLLGGDAVFVPEYVGGRDPDEQLRLVSASAVDLSVDRPAVRAGWVRAPWPGQLPNPSPATVLAVPEPVDVLDAGGRAVVVDGRCEPTAPPAQVRIGNRRRRVVSWAGPWPVDERWWDPDRHSRRVRFQVVTDDGVARLLVLARGQWVVMATYD